MRFPAFMEKGKLLRYEEAALRCDLSLSYFRREVARGHVIVVRLGPRSVRVSEADLATYIQERRERTTA
jgi:excisionase family DNA binding protein